MTAGAASKATKIFGEPLVITKGSEYYELLCYVFEEAVWVVAKGGDPSPFLGKTPLQSFASPSLLEFTRDTNWGAYYLARDQLVRSVMSSRLSLFGTISPETTGDHDVAHVFKIPPELIEPLDVFDDDEPTSIQGIEFDEILVPAAELESLFDFGPPLSQLFESKQLSGVAEDGQKSKQWPRVGRPRKWDWDRILAEVVLLANTPDGIPEKQSDLENWVCARCRELFDDEPSVSQVRKKVAPIYQSLRS